MCEGGEEVSGEKKDVETLFSEERFFFCLFRIYERGYSGTLQVKLGDSGLCFLRLLREYGLWRGEVLPPDFYGDYYRVEYAFYDDKVADR
eukprot:EC689076.1.p3 GENE.EC689076.1~~EC689076.1.p3  ORF type:complete len:90 (+),score=20.81 EC689076.1:190-459(+)